MDFHNNIFAGPPSQLFSQGRASSCSETTASSPNPPLAAVAVGIADPCNPSGACDRCASRQGKSKFLFSGSEFSHRRVAFKFGVCSQSTDRKSLPLAHLWWLCGKSQLSQSLPSGLRPRQELPLPLSQTTPDPKGSHPHSLWKILVKSSAQMLTRCCWLQRISVTLSCLSKAHGAAWGVGREVTPKAGPCPRQCTQYLRGSRGTGTQQKRFLFLFMYTLVFPAKC